MRKLLIIDDEYLVRIGIRETIDWEKYDIEIVGEAVNGKKGLEKTLELKPDIVISDIRMPIMDGLDYIKAVKEQDLDLVVITLSGYKDFEYAKEALVNGADQYLLKPIDNNELIKAVLSALDKLEDKRKNKLKIKSIENDSELINNAIILDILQKEYNNEIITEKIKSYNLNIPSNGQLVYLKLDNNSNNLELNNITQIVTTELEKDNYSFTVCKEENAVIFIINSIDEKRVSMILSTTIDNIKLEQNTISGYLSEPYNDLVCLSKMYKLAKNAVKNKLFLSINTFISSNISDGQKLHKTVIYGLKYIKDNYQYDISIRTCAEKLYVSESHLMHMFKDELGKTFNECLTEYRMFKAKSLLSTNKYKVYEVSYMVGYNDTKYFSQVFKKFNGISPNDFINKNYEEQV